MSDRAITIPASVLCNVACRKREKTSSGDRFLACLTFLILASLAAGQAHASLNLAIAVNPDPVRSGDRLRSEFTVTNTTGSVLSNVVLQAQIPIGVNTFLPSLLTGGGSCVGNGCDPGEQVTWTMGALAPGAGLTVAMPAIVASGVVDGTLLQIDAVATADGIGQTQASHTVTVDSNGAWMLALNGGSDTVIAGAQLGYALTYLNRSDDSISGTTLSVPLPVGTTFVSAAGGGALNGSNVEWSLGTLSSGQSGHRQFVVVADSGLAAGTILQVDAAAISGINQNSLQPEVAKLMAVTRVVISTPPLALAIEMNPDPVAGGIFGTLPFPFEIRSELTVINTTDGILSNVLLQARVPDGVDTILPSDITGGGDCTGQGCDPGELVTWTIGNLAPGSGVTVAMPAVVDLQLIDNTLLKLDAVATADGGALAQSSHTIVVDSDGALTLELNENLDPVVAGGRLVYTLIYGNSGSSSISGTTLSLPLPTGTTFRSATGGGTLLGRTVEWNLGTLLAGESGRRQVVVIVNGGLPAGTILAVDAAAFSGTNPATLRLESARSMSVTRVAASTPPLSLAIEMNPDPVGSAGLFFRLKLTVTNNSGGILNNVVLQAQRPNRQANLWIVGNNGNCATFLCTWNIGTLAAGSGVTVEMLGSLGPSLVLSSIIVDGMLLQFDAVVTADGGWQTQTSHTVAVDRDGPLVLDLTNNLSPVTAGGQLVYTLTFGNHSNVSVSGTTMSLPLPVGTVFVSATGEGVMNGDTVNWTMGTLAAGESGHRKVVVMVDGALPPGTLLSVDAAEISGTNPISFRPETARSTVATRVVASPPPLALALEMNPDPLMGPGERLRSEIIVTNTTGGVLNNVVLRGRLSDSITRFDRLDMTTGGCTIDFFDFDTCIWTIGTLAPGAGVAVTRSPVLATGVVDGALVQLDAVVTAEGRVQIQSSHTVAVNSVGALRLELNEDVDAVLSGGQLVYTLSYGNRSLSNINGTTMSLPLPAGTVFVSATGGATLNGNTVEWNLGTLLAGNAGHRRVMVAVDGGLPAGMILSVDAAVISGTNAVNLRPEVARSMAATRVATTAPLGLDVQILAPNQPGDTMTTHFTVNNRGVSTLFGIVLQARVPDGASSFSDNETTGGGTCSGTTCFPGEQVTWTIGTLLPAAAVRVEISPVVLSDLLSGDLITVNASVTDDGRRQATDASTVIIGPFADADFDGMTDEFEIANGFDPNNPADADEDADNDGLTNLEEFIAGTNPHNPDTDGDGVIDGLDALPLDPTESIDTDGDGIGDNADPDDDNDGVLDGNDNCPLIINTDQLDTELDGIGNACDPDDDNDGQLDGVDPFPLGFSDVPVGAFAFSFIERLALSGITTGCGNGRYCPDDSVTRAQMAVFLERGINGSGFVPAGATGMVFNDVPAGAFAANFIEQLFMDGITSGCGNNNYCPNATVTRAQMAVFLLRAKHGAGFIPPPATGIFTDAPLGSFAVNWIEQLAAEGITAGCGGGNYCPAAAVTRDQMAVFLVRAFGL